MKDNKTTLWGSIKSLFTRLFKPGGGIEELEEYVGSDDIILSPSKQIAKNFFENKLGIAGLISFVLIFAIVFGGSAMMKYNAYEHETILGNLAPGRNFLKVDKNIDGKNIVDISSGTSFSVALDDKGEVYFWGQRPFKKFEVDKIVELTEGKKIASIAAGDNFVIAVTENGKFIGVGENSFNQAELPFIVEDDMTKPIIKVGAGTRVSAALTEDGKIFTWGGVLENNLDRIPAEIQGRVVDFEVGQFNIAAILDDGTVNVFGTRGTEVAKLPEELTDGSVNVKKVAMSKTSAMGLDDQGKIYTWGANGKFQSVPEIDGKIKDISSTYTSFSALSENGKVYSWGDGKFDLTSVPKDADSSVDRIYSDVFQQYAIHEDGTIDAWGNKGFILGTDSLGRSVSERLIQGGKISLTVGAIAMVISITIGVIVGLIAGFYGGWIDNLLMRIAEVISAFPFLPLAITLSAMLPSDTPESQRLYMIMVILGILTWPGVARLVRGQILAEREKDFVLAAKALGLRENVIILRHILPSVFNFIIVNLTLGYASSLLTEAGLSYLGFGVQPPSPSWGNMLNGVANVTVIEYYWWQWLLPALCITFTALSVNLIGDALRDAMDPRSNQK
ncbi:ABC transporter permease subunit [Erysipelothrix urinaevulpis]|uniref:ABC transporter permease subunit n=1 Tax=Erysipelothrix urinaevulpis TaxID=2683717 RepID=UPI00135A56A7|nr:ABC transporter permease subunit [Erysipelothrix urinaevulpis]